MCLAQGQGKLPALLIARLKSLHLIGPVIHEGIIQRGSLSKPQIGSFDYQKTTGASLQMSYQKAPKGPFFLCRRWNYGSFGPSEWSELWWSEGETTITMRLEATLPLKMRKTTLCHVDPLLCNDRLALNTVRCLVPGCILTNERLLLGFGGQSTYGAVNSESKNKLLCKNPKCANTTGSKFNQLSLVAEIQLPFDYINKWNPLSMSLSLSPQTSLKAFTPRWWYSICYDDHFHLSHSSVRHKLNWTAVIRDLRDCHWQRERGIHREFPRLSL